MLTKHSCLSYHDFDKQIETKTLSLTPENACFVVFIDDFIREKNTDITQWFYEDQKQYMIIRFGNYSGQGIDYRVYLVARVEPTAVAGKNAPSFTMIRNVAKECPSFIKDTVGVLSYVRKTSKRMDTLVNTISETLACVANAGLYPTLNSTTFKAQLPRDRSGFHKTWINGYLIDEQNYGDCSLTFSLVGILVR